MEETVMVDPISDWKYPIVVDSDGTWMEDRTVKEDVTSASWEVRKLDWMEETVMVDPVNDWK
jgi:hypothetical protein